MLNDMMQKEGWTRSYALSVLRSKFESEERLQEVSYIEDLIRKEAEKQEQESELAPTATSTTTTEAEHIPTTTNEPEVTTRKPPKITHPRQQQQIKKLQGTIDTKSVSK
jgi:hypothetical protein